MGYHVARIRDADRKRRRFLRAALPGYVQSSIFNQTSRRSVQAYDAACPTCTAALAQH
jgi:hypothetical protein